MEHKLSATTALMRIRASRRPPLDLKSCAWINENSAGVHVVAGLLTEAGGVIHMCEKHWLHGNGVYALPLLIWGRWKAVRLQL